MLRDKRLTIAVLLVVLLTGALIPAPATAGAAPDARDPEGGLTVRVATSTGSGVTFEITVPWKELHVEPTGSGYVQVALPGWATTTQPGAPSLPTLAQAIGVPFGTALSVHAEPGPAHIVALPGPLAPVATQSIAEDGLAPVDGIPAQPRPVLALVEDAAIYTQAAVYPGALAEITGDGVVRQQRVAAIAAYPVQYNPATHELTIYEFLRVTVTFTAAAGQTPAASFQPAGAESAAYEELFRGQLLNYKSARPWRQATAPSTGREVEALAAPGVAAQAEVATTDDTLATDALAAEPLGIEALPWAPPNPGWRVKVRDEGFYKLTYTELQAAGLPVTTLDPRTFRLFNLGSEVAIEVSGETDGKFDPADTVVFYGQATSSKYTRDNVYWLTYGGVQGLRMASRDGAPGAAATPAYYAARRMLESNATYVSKAPGGDDLERWLWYQINTAASQPSWSTTFAIPAPYSGQYGEARLTVVMLGYLQNAIDPDHHVRVLLNGTQVADVTWDGITWKTVDVPIAQSLLLAGNNTLQVVAPNDTGVGSEVVYIDRAELRFANTFRAENNNLAFDYATAGTWKFQVDGFSSNPVAIYDVTRPAAVARIANISVTGTAPYAALFQDILAAPARYWATAAYKAIQAIEKDTASSLASTANGADHIIITHSAFAAQASTLSSHRAAQGLRAVVVDVQDVYDEFGYGIAGVAPIRDFLSYAYASWRAPAPSFVVLLGDGHFDPKNYLGYGLTNYVPAYLAAADPWIVETAADNRYVTLTGADTMPDMMLGRLAVNSAAEATAFVDKIIAYEASPAADWQQQVLAIADNADSAGSFAQLSDNLLRDELKAPYLASKVYYLVTHPTTAETRSAIQAGINAGKLLVNYIGHAGIGNWAQEGLFKVADVPSLTNTGKYPVMLAMTCYDGSYHYPLPPSYGYDALAEVVTRTAARGAVASWSPTGLGVATGHDYLNRGFYRAAFTTGVATVGEATQAGKLNLFTNGGGLDLLDTYLLFGDPATRFPHASCTPPEAVKKVWIALVAANQVELTWDAVAATASGSTIQYQVWWNAADPYFTPATGAACTEANGCALTPNPVFPHDGAGNTAANYTYLVRPAADCGAVCATLSNRTGEFDFALVPGG